MKFLRRIQTDNEKKMVFSKTPTLIKNPRQLGSSEFIARFMLRELFTIMFGKDANSNKER